MAEGAMQRSSSVGDPPGPGRECCEVKRAANAIIHMGMWLQIYQLQFQSELDICLNEILLEG